MFNFQASSVTYICTIFKYENLDTNTSFYVKLEARYTKKTTKNPLPRFYSGFDSDLNLRRNAPQTSGAEAIVHLHGRVAVYHH